MSRIAMLEAADMDSVITGTSLTDLDATGQSTGHGDRVRCSCNMRAGQRAGQKEGYGAGEVEGGQGREREGHG